MTVTLKNVEESHNTAEQKTHKNDDQNKQCCFRDQAVVTLWGGDYKQAWGALRLFLKPSTKDTALCVCFMHVSIKR